MNNQLCKDNIICCDDNCQRCANLIYNKYVELQEENKRLKQEYEPVQHGEWIPHMINTFFGPKQYGWYCSLCERQELYQQPYCNCGAKMNGGN